MEDIIKKVKSLEDSSLLLKQIGETIQYEEKKKGGFLSMFSSAEGATFIRNMLPCKKR